MYAEIKATTTLKQCQGDVNLYKLPENPNIDGEEYKDPVIVYGDTGNHHKLSGTFKAKKAKDGAIVLSVIKKTILTHQQHGPIILMPGFYLVDRAKEKGMFDDMINPVAD